MNLSVHEQQEVVDRVMHLTAYRRGSSTRRDFEVACLAVAEAIKAISRLNQPHTCHGNEHMSPGPCRACEEERPEDANVSEVTRTDSVVAEGVTLLVGEKPALRDRVYEAAFYSGKPGDPFPELLEEYVRASHDECKADLDESQMQLAQAEVTIERLRRVLADTHNHLTMILAHAKEGCERLNAVEFPDDPAGSSARVSHGA